METERHESFERVDLLIQLGRLTEADEAAASQVELLPDHPRSWIQFATIRLRQGRHVEAVEAAGHAARLAPQSASAHTALAEALAASGYLTEAREAADRAVELEPHAWVTYYTLAAVLARDWRSRGAALVAAKQAVTLNPHNANTHNLLGICHQALGYQGNALESFQAGLRIDPHHTSLLSNLASLQLKERDASSAARSLMAGLAIDAQHDLLARHLVGFLLLVVARLALAAELGLWLIAILDAGVSGSHWPSTLRTLAGVVFLVGCAWYASKALHEFPRESRMRIVLTTIRHEPRLMAAVGVTALLIGLCGILAFGPARPTEKLFALTLQPPGFGVWLVLILGTIATATRLVHSRR